jgi:cytochrome P450
LPAIWPSPADAFRPERWEGGEQPPRHAYLPFLTGARQCVGDSFAWTEMLTVVATISARWQLRLAPGSRVREVARATVRPSRLTMVPVPRRD